MEPSPAYKIDFTSAKAKKDRLENYVASDCAAAPQRREKKVPVPAAAAPSAEKLNNLLSKLRLSSDANTASSILKVHPHFCNDFVTEEPNIPEPACEKMEIGELLEHCRQMEIRKPTVKQVQELEELTQGQSRTGLWFQARAGWITASNMYAACQTAPDRLAKSVMNTICPSDARDESEKKKRYVPAIQWGKEHETQALGFYMEDTAKNHFLFTCKSSGFFISPDYPFIGTSPDAVVECSCCDKGCVEVKCPYTKRFQSVNEIAQDENFCLR